MSCVDLHACCLQHVHRMSLCFLRSFQVFPRRHVCSLLAYSYLVSPNTVYFLNTHARVLRKLLSFQEQAYCTLWVISHCLINVFFVSSSLRPSIFSFLFPSEACFKCCFVTHTKTNTHKYAHSHTHTHTHTESYSSELLQPNKQT